MRESGYYPPGAEFDTNAPYNQVENETKDFDCDVTCTLCKCMSIPTTMYREIIEPPCEPDDFGCHCFEFDDDINWEQELASSKHLDPLDLITAMANEILALKEKEMSEIKNEDVSSKETRAKIKHISHLSYLLDEASDWELIETEIEPI